MAVERRYATGRGARRAARGALAAGMLLVAVACCPYDFDRNGVADLAYVDDDTGAWYRVGSSTPIFTPSSPASGAKAVAGDYDGDGVWEPASWTPAGWETAGPAGIIAFVPWSYPGVACPGHLTTVPADYDGDGATEPAVWYGCDSTWVVHGDGAHRYGHGSDVAGEVAFDVPVPADYDGDGDDDVAVYRPTDGTFHVEGVGQIADLPLGLPAPGDYDGDGTADPAVLTFDGSWYVDTAESTDGGFASWEPDEVCVPVPAQYAGSAADDLAVFCYGGYFLFPDGSTKPLAGYDQWDQPGAARDAVVEAFIRLASLAA